MEKNFDLENKMFETVLSILAIGGAINIFVNIAIKLPVFVNIKWLVLIGLSLLFKYKFKCDDCQEKIKLVFFILAIFIFIPAGYFDAAGDTASSLAYVFLALICISFFFDGKIRLGLVISLLVVVLGMHIFAYLNPSIIRQDAAMVTFFDRLMQLPITIIAAFILLKSISNEYRREKAVLDKYSRELEYLATRDALTGLYNRRYFDIHFNEALEKVRSTFDEVYLLIFDIDYFKRVNDDFGHMQGDLVIKSLAKHTNTVFDQSGVISRWGGDEFAILYNGSRNELETKLGSLRNNLDDGSKSPNYTVSIGITKLSQGDTVDHILKRADDALYMSKANGKDQTTYN